MFHTMLAWTRTALSSFSHLSSFAVYGSVTVPFIQWLITKSLHSLRVSTSACPYAHAQECHSVDESLKPLGRTLFVLQWVMHHVECIPAYETIRFIMPSCRRYVRGNNVSLFSVHFSFLSWSCCDLVLNHLWIGILTDRWIM